MTGRILPFAPLLATRIPTAAASVTVLGRGKRASGVADAAPLDPHEADRFRQLILPHLDGAYSFARFLCRDASLAEDLVQDAFLRAYRGFRGFRGGDPRAWLFAIVRSSHLTTAQKRTETPADPETFEDTASEAPTPEAALVQRGEIETVRSAVAALPEPFRETLVLRELEDLSYREIAGVTGAPIGTVMSRLARARQMLLAALPIKELPAVNPCPDKEALLHGLLDGELDAANAQACEAHIKTCPACAEAFGELQALRDQLAAPGVAYEAPAGLRLRIEEMLTAEAAPKPRPRLRTAAPWALSGGFAAIAASLAVVMVQANVATLESQLVANHVRSTLASHLVDVETSNRHVVKPWFNGRIDFAPPVVELADAGYPLVGGRLDYVDERVVAALVYRRNLHVINVFVWPSKPGVELPAPAAPRDGYSVAHWRNHGLEFWAVSDIDAGDLEAFHKTFVARAPT